MNTTEQKIERFIHTLETLGGSAGNQKLRDALGWEITTYDSIKAQLLAQGRIMAGRGRGGSVSLSTAAQAASASSSPQLLLQEAPAAAYTQAVPRAEKKPKAAAKNKEKTVSAAIQLPAARSGIIKKSDLYSSIWASCDELRGGMDASQYKDYVLFMLFIKYISDKYANSDDFAPPVIIPKGASFQDMVALKGKNDIGDRINTQVIQPLIEANSKLARSDFPDFNDPNKLGEGKERVDRLTNLIAIFEKPELNFGKHRAENDDLLGDAYEYLMRHFATESGKSKGQFYTPAEVSRVIAQAIGISPENTKGATTAYDPTCGSGSLLLKVAAEAGKQITLEGQEKDVTTAGLARMNMILHNFPSANILSGNTLADPKFRDGNNLRTYDYVVANPPFSDKAWRNGIDPANDPWQRFAWGEPPAKQGDYAYLLHVIRSMKPNTGKGAIILPHGVLFRGNAEASIRKELVNSGILKAIIGLPANLFYGTGIPACILVLDKENAQARKGILMIDASKGFIKDGAKNRLRERDIHHIIDTFRQGKDVERYARMVPLDEIKGKKNDYNLNLPRYIDSSEPEDLQDIDAHLNGGIPERDLDAFAADWQEMPGLRSTLFEEERPGYARLRVPISDIRATILAHPEFNTFRTKVEALFDQWQQSIKPQLEGFQAGGNPKALIHAVSEALLGTFRTAPLLDAYAIYQHLMDYWVETLQDDTYLISADGWVAQPRRIQETDKKGKTRDKDWTCDLLPKPYVVARYLATEQEVLNARQTELERINNQIAELEEEHSGEDGVFDGFEKINASEVKSRIAEIGNDTDSKEELDVLQQWQQLTQQASNLKATIKRLDADLEQKTLERYTSLTEGDVKNLLLNDKWLARLKKDIQQEVDAIAQTLGNRIRELAERYETPLPRLEAEVAAWSAKVEQHLKKMGVVWK